MSHLIEYRPLKIFNNLNKNIQNSTKKLFNTFLSLYNCFLSRCLLKHRFLHYHPEKATQIINACTVLHNICIINKVPLPTNECEAEIDMGIIEQNIPNNEILHVHNDLVQGRNVRSKVISYMHRNRQH